MRVKLTAMAAVLVCACTFGASWVMSPVATAASPDICETACGGSAGAGEDAKEDAEKHKLIHVKIVGCERNTEYDAEWDCWGTGELTSENDDNNEFHAWIGPYGGEKEYHQHKI